MQVIFSKEISNTYKMQVIVDVGGSRSHTCFFPRTQGKNSGVSEDLVPVHSNFSYQLRESKVTMHRRKKKHG